MDDLFRKIKEWAVLNNIDKIEPLLQTTNIMFYINILQYNLVHYILYNSSKRKCNINYCKYLIEIKKQVGNVIVDLILL